MDEFEHLKDLLPDDQGTVVPEFGLRLISYVGEDGESKWNYEFAGEGNLSSFVGLVEMAKSRWLHHAFSEED
jgi:hypothetical protein